jgi:5-deoxy-glucuronate isomerase
VRDKLDIVIPAGTGGSTEYTLSITPERAGWGYSSLNVLELAAGGAHTFTTGESEWVVLPLTGRAAWPVTARLRTCRPPRGLHPRHRLRLRAPRRHRDGVVRGRAAGSRSAGARATRRLTARYGPPMACRSSSRSGPGQPAGQQLLHSRDLRGRQADRRRGDHPGRQLVVVPSAQARRGGRRASRLEEVYYFEADSAYPAGQAGACGYQRVYARARQGDRRLRRGAHGRRDPDPARLARSRDGAPGYDLYYLNVMAGPDPERVWKICDDPAHAWVRGLWEDSRSTRACP